MGYLVCMGNWNNAHLREPIQKFGDLGCYVGRMFGKKQIDPGYRVTNKESSKIIIGWALDKFWTVRDSIVTGNIAERRRESLQRTKQINQFIDSHSPEGFFFKNLVMNPRNLSRAGSITSFFNTSWNNIAITSPTVQTKNCVEWTQL